MTSVPRSVYRSMVRYCLKEDPQVKLHMRTGLMTYIERPYPFYNFKYYHNNNMEIIYGPYFNETTSLLSYTKHLIRNNEKCNFSIERLFYAHRELPNFIEARNNLEKEEEQKKINQNSLFDKPPDKSPDKPPDKPTSFGTAFY